MGNVLGCLVLISCFLSFHIGVVPVSLRELDSRLLCLGHASLAMWRLEWINMTVRPSSASALLTLFALLLILAPSSLGQGVLVLFDDSGADIRLSNGLTELTSSKENGGILAIVDLTRGANLSHGSRYGCLWGAVMPRHTSDFIGGCSYDASQANRFSYVWHRAHNRLDLDYDRASTETGGLDALVSRSVAATTMR